MKVLARFPALDAHAAIPIADGATALSSADPQAPDVTLTTAAITTEVRVRRPRAQERRRQRRYPGGSVVVLAGLAVIAWTLASWNDARRAERSRAERLARVQSAFSSAGTLAR